MCEGLWLSKGGNRNILNSCHLPRTSPPPALGWGGVLQTDVFVHTGSVRMLGMWLGLFEGRLFGFVFYILIRATIGLEVAP